jgi:subtilisin family serine protease
LSERRAAEAQEHWLEAQPDDGSTNTVEFGDQVVLELAPGTKLDSLVKGKSLALSRTVSSNIFLLQAPNAVAAAREAARLADAPGVRASYPIIRQAVALDGLFSARPNDPHYPPQLANVVSEWHLENRDTTNGAVLGPDLNVRAAWAYTRGEGVTIAIGDTGIELPHRDLTNRTIGAPHRNFGTGLSNATPFTTNATWAHGTECAGLAAAESDNAFGMAGVAPRAKLAGWVVFTNTTSLRLVSDDRLMDMFQYASNIVDVQNHSWTHVPLRLSGLTTLENLGMENAVQFGRRGRGTVIVRPAGNDRSRLASPNDDGYCNDPRVITVAAVGRNGRVTEYSERGSSVLVAAPSGDLNGNGLFTTDLIGMGGAMFFSFFAPFEYLSDFTFNSLGFNGTSASAPQVAGVAALMLSVNTNLAWRDVQQILLLSARHFDRADPDLMTNGAGLAVSHNLGFGVVDAGQAVRLARQWVNRTEPATLTASGAAGSVAIPDDGLRLLVTGPGVPENIASIRCLPGTGPHPDVATVPARLVDLGLATNTVLPDLRGRAALMERGANNFDQKITNAARAGAEFAVIYNYATNSPAGSCPGGEQLCLMGATDFVPIPSVFIARADGLALQALFATNSAARARLSLNAAVIPIDIVDGILCEHVGVQVQTDHPLRGDVRITLVSPAGTRSVLQQYNTDTTAGPVDWTYWTTHHFFEPGLGRWRVEVSDESAGAAGSVLAVTLVIRGVPMLDDDADGLDDFWEGAMFGSLELGPRDDPDEDGYNNAFEQALGTDPLLPNEPSHVDVMQWDAKLARLSWPALNGRTYGIFSGTNAASLTLLTNVSGRFPEAEWFISSTNPSSRFFRVREIKP